MEPTAVYWRVVDREAVPGLAADLFAADLIDVKREERDQTPFGPSPKRVTPLRPPPASHHPTASTPSAVRSKSTGNPLPPALATILYSILSGDSDMAGWFGVDTSRLEDSVRRAPEDADDDADDDAVTAWIDQQMDRTFAPLLAQEWVLDLDTTIKALYGHQQHARVRDNPTKPGRPFHVYPVIVLAAGKLVLNVDTQAGNQSASEYARPTPWGWLAARDRNLWPTLLRGDIAHASEKRMAGAEQRQLPYLFKQRQTPHVARTIARLAQIPVG